MSCIDFNSHENFCNNFKPKLEATYSYAELVDINIHLKTALQHFMNSGHCKRQISDNSVSSSDYIASILYVSV